MSTLGTYTNRLFFSTASWTVLVGPALLGLGGYIAGAGAGLLLRLDRPQVIALSLETAMQNAGTQPGTTLPDL